MSDVVVDLGKLYAVVCEYCQALERLHTTAVMVDSSCAIRIIGETALGNIAVLKVFQNLAKGSLPKSKSSPEKFSEMEEAGDEDDLASLESGNLVPKIPPPPASTPWKSNLRSLGIRDKVQLKHDRATSFMSGSIETKHSPGSSSYRTIPDISSCNESQLDSAGGMKRWSGSHLSDVHDVNDEDSDLAPGDNSLVDQRNDDVTKANQSTCTNFYSEGSEGTSEKTDPKNWSLLQNRRSNNYGITGWPWEVAYVFTETLTNICLYGKNANIKKFALIGNRTGLNVTQPKKAGEVSEQTGVTKLKSAGLLDLAEIKVSKQKDAEDVDDWSWRVRYAAISGLVKISRSCQNDQSMEGMSNVVWNMLMIRHSKERDERVMEAFRVGHPPNANQRRKQKFLNPKNHHAGVLHNLLTTRITTSNSTARTSDQLLQQERSRFERIVEDQWRKELQEEMEAEEKQKQEELEKNQREIEKEQLEIAEKKEEKIGKTLSSEEMTAA
ncbi:hypothetical protein BSL78_30032 [Apostichopus japonicus]|uniref:Uncharacterized protein n=1 Tax=Stichopus japonicus TaxID=307972 RepID=A0A2G8JBN5_STIJA|nr:hypothetical protein BSL78_30032 [Apostichopus japonicus]